MNALNHGLGLGQSAGDGMTATFGDPYALDVTVASAFPCLPQGASGPLAPGQNWCNIPCMPQGDSGPLAPNQMYCPGTGIVPASVGPSMLSAITPTQWLILGGVLLMMVAMGGRR